MGLFSTKDRHEFKPLLVELEDSPTSPLARWLFWILTIIMILIVSWLYFAKVDVVVSARGKVIPSGEIKIVQPIETGVVKEILVKEGEFVKKNQLLMRIDPSVTQSNLESKNKNAKLLEIEEARLMALIEDRPFSTDRFSKISTSVIETQYLLYQSTKQSHQQQIRLVKEQLQQVRQQSNSLESDISRVTQLLSIVEQREAKLAMVLDIIAKKDYESVQNQMVEYQEQLEMKRHEVLGLESKTFELNQQIQLIQEEYRNRLLEELTQKRKENTILNAEIESIRFQNAKQLIKSPVDGYIAKLLVHTEGGVVTPAEKLMMIVPKDAPLMFKATVMNQDIGFVKKDMNVSVKIDTFNFQKYGLVEGTVIHVADDAIEDEKMGPIYEVLIQPKEYFLEYGDEKFPINSGMSLTAEMKVGKRRVITFFLYPLIRYLDEGISVR